MLTPCTLLTSYNLALELLMYTLDVPNMHMFTTSAASAEYVELPHDIDYLVNPDMQPAPCAKCVAW
jgi:hypothetical protein